MAEPYGVLIQEERVRQGLSQNMLSQLAGISRRHLASLENGANVSIGILKAVSRALGITEINLGDGLTAHDKSPDVARAALLPFVEQIAAEATRVGRIGKELKAFARTGIVKPASPPMASDEPVNSEAAHLVELVSKFAKSAAVLRDRKTIKALERDVTELLKKSHSA